MFGIYASFIVKDGMVDQALSAVEEMIEKTRLEEGNISYKLFASVDNPNAIAFFEEWKDQAAIDAHSSSDHFNNGLAKLSELLAEEGQIKIYKLLA